MRSRWACTTSTELSSPEARAWASSAALERVMSEFTSGGPWSVARRRGRVRCGRGGRSVFGEDARHGEPLLVLLRRAGERGLGAEGRTDLVGAGDVGQRERVRHRLDVPCRHLLHLRDGFEDDTELTDHAVELGVGEVDAGEAGEVGDVVPGQCGHAGQSRGAAGGVPSRRRPVRHGTSGSSLPWHDVRGTTDRPWAGPAGGTCARWRRWPSRAATGWAWCSPARSCCWSWG